jgi:outer membrane biosynthesis protein TonB
MKPARERTRNFLVYGIALSIAVHLGIMPFVHAEKSQAAEQKPDVFDISDIPTPPPTPPPTPTPAPTARPTQPPREKPRAPASPRAIRIVTAHTDARRGGRAEPANAHPAGDPNGVPDAPTAAPAGNDALVKPAASPEPTPRPTPTPLSCARPDIPATTVRAVEPETPALAQQQAISGTVAVIVSLDTHSRVVATRIQSSPSAVLNGAALAAARGSQFKTEVKNCEPIAADYIFSVDFTSQ